MKRSAIYFLPILFFLGVSRPSVAQIEKGKILLAGNTAFSTASLKTQSGINYSDPATNSAKSLELTSEAGIFVANNLAIGLAIRYKNDELKSGYQSYTSSSFYAIPFIKAYFGKEILRPFIYGGIGIGKSNDDQSGYGTLFANVEKNLTLYEFGGGFAYFMNKNVSLEIGAAYSHVGSKYQNYNGVDMEDKGKGFGFTVGINLCL